MLRERGAPEAPAEVPACPSAEDRRLLALRPVRGERRGRRVVALLPAHDEEASLGSALASLARQSEPPHDVVVVADNCSDDTAGVARAYGARVLESVGNRHKKAGALNQALGLLLPGLADDDLVLVMDADSLLDP
ncbi:MAG: glycosyltransferase, partial [Marmoricola sp.]